MSKRMTTSILDTRGVDLTTSEKINIATLSKLTKLDKYEEDFDVVKSASVLVHDTANQFEDYMLYVYICKDGMMVSTSSESFSGDMDTIMDCFTDAQELGADCVRVHKGVYESKNNQGSFFRAELVAVLDKDGNEI